MGFNVVASLIVVLLGGAVEIYSFSNVGYTVSFIPVLIGYFLLRQDKPDLRRPFKLPEFMKYVALALAAVYFVFWLFGGLWYSKIGNVEIYYWLGWATLLAYLPFTGTGSTSKTSGRPRSKAGANLLELDVPTGANLAPVPLADMATRVLLLKSPLALTPAAGFL